MAKGTEESPTQDKSESDVTRRFRALREAMELIRTRHKLLAMAIENLRQKIENLK